MSYSAFARQNIRMVVWLFGVVASVAVAGCSDDDDDGGEGGANGGSGTPSVNVSSQVLDEVSTLVSVDSASSAGSGFMVIHEQSNGNPGAIIGSAPLSSGTNTDVDVTLSRPAKDGETLYAMLHSDSNGNGTFDGEEIDLPVHDSNAAIISPSFRVTVLSRTPAVILKVDNVNNTAWKWTGATPSSYASSIISAGTGNQTITLKNDWRYKVDQSSVDTETHPFEFTNGAAVAQLSQSADGAMESTDSVDWQENSNSVTFTASSEFRSAIEKYRCAVHTSAMVGSVTYSP